MDQAKLTDKKWQRIESKKKKAKAFIDLLISKESQQSTMEKPAGSKIPGVTMSIYDYRKLIQEKYTQKIMAMERPKLFLCLDDLRDKPHDPQPLLYMSDLQRLLLCMLQGPRATIKPRWCRLLRVSRLTHIVVVVLNDVSDLDLAKYGHCFPNIAATFKTCVDMVCSAQYGIPFTDEIFVVQQATSEKTAVKTPKNGEVRKDKDQPKVTNKEDDAQCASIPPGLASCGQFDQFPRTDLILTKSEMIHEGFPVPVYTKYHTYHGYMFTRDNYVTPTPQSPMFAIDCEMCLTSIHVNELTRISIVNEKLEVVYDTLVKPHNHIINYLTQFSGITKSLLSPVTTRLSDVQQAVRSLLPDDAILVGHSLCGDLKAMKMFHPYVIDTSVAYNTKGVYGMKTSLRELTRIFLGRQIQNHGAKGHNSAEDAIATLELVLLKLQHDIAFGDCLQEGLMAASFTMHDNWYRDMLNGRTDMQNSDKLEKKEAINGAIDLINAPNSEKSLEESIEKSPEKRKCHEKNIETPKKLKLSTDGTDVTNSGGNSEPSRHYVLVSDEDTAKRVDRTCRTEKLINCERSEVVSDNTMVKVPVETLQTMSSESNGSDHHPGLKSCKLFNAVQRSHFFSRKVNTHSSLLEYAAKGNKSVSLINESGVGFKHCQSFTNVERIDATTDKEARVKAVEKVQGTDFTWVRLRRYESLLRSGATDEVTIENCLKKLDHRAEKIVSAAPVHSASIVVMPGRFDESGEHNAKVFLKTQVPAS